MKCLPSEFPLMNMSGLHRSQNISKIDLILSYLYNVVSTNQIRFVAFNLPQLTQASFLQKNLTLQWYFVTIIVLTYCEKKLF